MKAQPAAVPKWRRRVLASEFDPKFHWTSSLEVAADMINQPHDDYPSRVPQTAGVLEGWISALKRPLAWQDACLAHALMWRDCNPKRIAVGQVRRGSVWVGGKACPPHWVVPHLLDLVFPVNRGDDLVDWYRTFQAIHPFEDGNGRVGGVIVAALSFLNEGRYLAPLQ